MKPRSAKNKGKALQNLVAQKIRKMLEPFGVEPPDVKSTTMGESGEDVQLSPFARRLLPISVECKSHARMALYSFWEQATDEADNKGTTPILVVKANRKKPLVVVDLDYWIKLEENRIIRKHK